MSTLVTILHVIVAIFLMLTVLLQSGKGGGMGAAFGGGNAATVFGGSGASSFLKKLTAASATIFMLTSITLAFIASHDNADALEKFGKQQDGLRSEKEKATQKALDDAAKNNGSGSAAKGSASSGSAAGSNTTPAVTPEKPATPDGGSNAKTSATHDPNPATIPDSMKPATGSNTKAVDTSVTKPDVPPTKPVTGPAKTETKPAEKPAP